MIHVIRINIVQTRKRTETPHPMTAAEAVEAMAEEQGKPISQLARELLAKSPELIRWAKKQGRTVIA